MKECRRPWRGLTPRPPGLQLDGASKPRPAFCLGFNDTSTLMDHFVLSSRDRERDKRDSIGDKREGQERKRNRNEMEETEEIKTFTLYPYLL